MLAESFLAEYKFKLKLHGRNEKKKKKRTKIIAKTLNSRLAFSHSIELSPLDFPRANASPSSNKF